MHYINDLDPPEITFVLAVFCLNSLNNLFLDSTTSKEKKTQFD